MDLSVLHVGMCFELPKDTRAAAPGLYMIIDRVHWATSHDGFKRVKIECMSARGRTVEIEDCTVDDLTLVSYPQFMAVEAMMDRQKKALNIQTIKVPFGETVMADVNYAKLEKNIMESFGVPKEAVGADGSR